MKKLLLFSLLVSLMSCDENQPVKMTEQPQSKTSFSDVFEVEKNREVTLLPEARQVAAGWLAYVTAHDEIENLENKTGSEIMAISGNLMQIMESLRTTLPDTLRSPSVEARTNVLFTKAHVLHQLSNKKQKNPDEIFEVAGNLITEFDNFKLQLNEMFLKTPENFELELDKEFEESQQPDSTGTIPLFGEREIIR